MQDTLGTGMQLRVIQLYL